MSAPPSRVAVIGDCPLFRRGLAQVVGAADDLECTVGAPSVDEAEDALQPGDVVLLDLRLPPAELAAVVHRLNARGLEVVVLCSELQRGIVPPMQAGSRRRVDLTRFAPAHDIVPDDLPQQGNP
ncbi:hypothetical protein [Kitasatospora sp. NPDC051914]|uniref:response regulator transcription factor n=1 Tax=Kitasatospora sp. NPDC051914 TaxID=3154945 RepID=UPI003417B9F2